VNPDCRAAPFIPPRIENISAGHKVSIGGNQNTMPTTAALFLLLFQAGGPADPLADNPAVHCEWCAARSMPAAEFRPPDPKYQEQDFVRRFNQLATALTDFSKTYRQGVIDVKQIKAIRKALRDFEKSEWFSRKRE
jgi:hypothetical protein